MHKLRILTLSSLFFLSACAHTDFVEKDSEIKSQSVYATGAAMISGNYAAAETYNKGAQSLTPTPKTPISVLPLNINGTNCVVIPERFSTTPVVYVGSQEYISSKDAVAIQKKADDFVASQVTKQKQTDQEVTNAMLKEIDELKSQIATYQKSIFYKMYSGWDKFILFLKIGVPILGVVGLVLILLYFFYPPFTVLVTALLPTLTGLGAATGNILKVAWSIISGIFSWIKSKF